MSTAPPASAPLSSAPSRRPVGLRHVPLWLLALITFSGTTAMHIFVPALASANRMVLTAARPDRSSFGCGEADRYPYFDECFLSSISGARTLPALATAVQGCVATREVKEGMKPPSEPQLFIAVA